MGKLDNDIPPPAIAVVGIESDKRDPGTDLHLKFSCIFNQSYERELADLYCVSQGNISAILLNRTWKHVA